MCAVEFIFNIEIIMHVMHRVHVRTGSRRSDALCVYLFNYSTS